MQGDNYGENGFDALLLLLLNRGRAEKTLEGLRRRTANLFLQFIETPEFNPESTRLTTVPRDLMMRQNVQPISSGQQ